jgi:hypothetical protein
MGQSFIESIVFSEGGFLFVVRMEIRPNGCRLFILALYWCLLSTKDKYLIPKSKFCLEKIK